MCLLQRRCQACDPYFIHRSSEENHSAKIILENDAVPSTLIFLEGLMTRFFTFATLVACLGIGGGFASAMQREDRPIASGRNETSPRFEPRQGSNSTTPPEKKAGPPHIAPVVSPAKAALPEPVLVLRAKSGEEGVVRTVYPLQSISADPVVAALQQLFKTEGRAVPNAVADPVVIVPVVASNSLLISGSPAAVGEVKRLLGELDLPPAVVRLDVRMIEVPGEKVKKSAGAGTVENRTAGKGASKELYPVENIEEDGVLLLRGEIATLSGQQGTLRVGAAKPTISGVSQSRIGVTNSVSYMDMGTLIRIVPRINRFNGIVVELQVVDSRFGPEEEGVVLFTPDKGPPQRAPNVGMFKADATLYLQDGRPLLLGGMSSGGKTGKQRLLSVTAHIVRPTTEKNAKP
jgi:hypothetical protein